jgi:putative sigma-54 modulation protein
MALFSCTMPDPPVGKDAIWRIPAGSGPVCPISRCPKAQGGGVKFVITTISSRHMDVTPPLRDYAESKAGKLTRYYDRIQEIEVVFDNGKDAIRVEMIVNAEHKNMFVAHHDDGDAYACIDGCVDKLERQLSDHKKKIRNRKHPEGGAKGR